MYSASIRTAVLACLLIFAAAWYSSGASYWPVWLAVACAGGLAAWFLKPPAQGYRQERWLIGTLWVLSAYAAFQLVPLPGFALNALSPAHAELARAAVALGGTSSWAPLSLDPAAGWEHIFRLLGYALTCVSACLLYRRFRDWTVAYAILIAGSLEALIGLVQYGTDRAHGTLINPDHYSAFLELALPFAVMFAALNVSRWRNTGHQPSMALGIKAALGFAATLIILVAIVAALSRIGLIAALASVVVCGVLSLPRTWGWGSRSAVAAGLLAAAALAVVALAPAKLVSRMSSASGRQSPVSDPLRFGMWKDTAHLIADYPITGVGLGAFGAVYAKYQTTDLEHAIIYSHNDYLQIPAELGVVGAALVGGIVLLLFWMDLSAVRAAAHRYNRFLAIACAGSLTALALHCFFDFNLYIPPVALLASWISGVGAGIYFETRPKAEAGAPEPWWRWSAVACAVALACYSSLALYATGRVTQNLSLERSLCPLGFCADTQVMDALYRKLRTPGQQNEAMDGFAQQVRRHPASAFAWMDLGQGLLLQNKPAQADQCYRIARQLAPNHPVALLRLANFYLFRGERKQALASGAHILSAVNTFDSAVFQLQANMRARAPEVIESGVFPGCRAVRSYFNSVLGSNQPEDLPAIWRWALEHHCSDNAAASAYVDFLIASGKPAEANSAWKTYAAHPIEDGNLLSNGGFELPGTANRFDWRIADPAYVSIVQDGSEARSGLGVLRLIDKGHPLPHDTPMAQAVYLAPGRYRLEAEIRVQDIRSDLGLALRVVDPAAPAKLSVTTDRLAGTQSWTKVEKRFQLTGAPRLIEVQLIRVPEPGVNGIPTGSAWVDNVKLVKLKSSGD